jgi:flavorubredoxin
MVIRIILIILGVLVIAVIVGFALMRGWDKEKPTKRENLKPEGDVVAKALIVYHPGGSGYAEDVAHWIGEGLRSNGWEVDLDRANSSTVTDLTTYNLLCVGSPTYAGKPRPPIVSYLERVQGLQGKKSVSFGTAAGDAEAADRLKEMLEAKGSEVIKVLKFLTGEKESAEKEAKDFGSELAKSTL